MEKIIKALRSILDHVNDEQMARKLSPRGWGGRSKLRNNNVNFIHINLKLQYNVKPHY